MAKTKTNAKTTSKPATDEPEALNDIAQVRLDDTRTLVVQTNVDRTVTSLRVFVKTKNYTGPTKKGVFLHVAPEVLVAALTADKNA